jgi:hypothetical protein
MANEQDTNSKGHEPSDNLKDPAQNKAFQISTTADAPNDSSLDDVSGGSWPLSTFSSRIYSPSNGG